MDRPRTDRLSHAPATAGCHTAATRDDANRLIVGLAEFSRRHALVVALGGLLLAALPPPGRGRHHLGVSTDTDRMFSRSLPWRQQAAEFDTDFPQFDNLLVAVIERQ